MTPINSRLARIENKRLMRQSVVILIVALLFLGLFLYAGIPALMNLAVIIGNAKTVSKFTNTDNSPPLAPFFDPLIEATNSATITISGWAEVEAKINLYKNEVLVVDTLVDESGKFIFNEIGLDNGSNGYQAKAVDKAGNESQWSSPVVIVYDNVPPILTIDKPLENQKFYSLIDTLIDVTGMTEPNVGVSLNEIKVVVTADGSFMTKFVLNEGENKLKFKAVDKAGNETVKELVVYYYR